MKDENDARIRSPDCVRCQCDIIDECNVGPTFIRYREAFEDLADSLYPATMPATVLL